jgi:DNA-binding NtrC family response regulator
VVETDDVILLDDDADLRDALGDIFSKIPNCHVLALDSVADLEKNIGRALQTKVAFLDMNLGVNEPNGLDAYNCLFERGYTGRIYFFTGHARNHPLVQAAQRLGRAEVLIKPVPIDLLIQFAKGERGKSEPTEVPLSF